MLENTPSHTAKRVALRRAAHQVLDDPRVFDDPLALRIVGAQREAEAAFRQDQREQTRFAKSMRAFMAVRSRVAEDELARAVARGVTQYVVLGAGLDTFAYRNPFGDRLRVFEVDYPATQAWKREQLRDEGIPEPDWLRYVPVDFEHQTAIDALTRAGMRRDQPALFAWLGVTMYLEETTVWSVLKAIASLPPGGGVVFDYAVIPEILSPQTQLVFNELSRRVARGGEPWVTFFDPRVLGAMLRATGFASLNDMGSEALNQAYFNGREDGLRVGGLAHVVTALV
jgi:methyltransferase (TIGR00027 family)